jgi:RimJ/RimL family protein N-acetyltransferase
MTAQADGGDEIVYETERCVVRNWRPSDAERVFDIYSRWEVAKWLGATPRAMEDSDGADVLVETWAERNRTEPAGRWAVERKADGVVAGTCILVPLPDGDGEYEVGWHLHPDSWGQGLASESARGALDYGRERYGLAECFAVVRPDNAPSLAVCRRLGMTALGTTTKYYQSELELFRIEL